MGVRCICILFHVGNLNVELMKLSTYRGGGVGSGQTFGRQSRVGSGRVNFPPGRVQEK